MLRDILKKVFQHYKILSNESLSIRQLLEVQISYLSQFTNEEIENEINQMEREGLLIATNNRITLTDDGEKFVYGPFSMENGIDEFMQIFNRYHCDANHIILFQSILADGILSPLTHQHRSEIITELENRGFISIEDNGRSIRLTESGFDYLHR